MAYVAVPDTDLDQDSPMKQGVLRQLRDNVTAINDDTVGLPHLLRREALDLVSVSVSGVLSNSTTAVNINMPPYSFFPSIRGGGGTTTTAAHFMASTAQGATALNPRFRISRKQAVSDNTLIGYQARFDYIADFEPSVAYTELTDAVLTAGEPVTSEIMLGLADNIEGLTQGADNAPKVPRAALDIAEGSTSGSIASAFSETQFTMERVLFFPMFRGGFVGTETIGIPGFAQFAEIRPELVTTNAAYDSDNRARFKMSGGFINNLVWTSNTPFAYTVRWHYMASVTPPGTADYTAVTIGDLGTNAVIREGGVTRLRDNTTAVIDGEPDAPKVRGRALNTAQSSTAGTAGANTSINITLNAYSLFPMVFARGTNVTSNVAAPNRAEDAFKRGVKIGPHPTVGTVSEPRFRLQLVGAQQVGFPYSVKTVYLV